MGYGSMTKQQIISMLNRLFSGCIFRHGNMIFERDASGVARYKCDRCDEFISIPWAAIGKDGYER